MRESEKAGGVSRDVKQTRYGTGGYFSDRLVVVSIFLSKLAVRIKEYSIGLGDERP